jgi:hypothetical protein
LGCCELAIAKLGGLAFGDIDWAVAAPAPANKAKLAPTTRRFRVESFKGSSPSPASAVDRELRQGLTVPQEAVHIVVRNFHYICLFGIATAAGAPFLKRI